jgi:opacity protein-like surface antigen
VNVYNLHSNSGIKGDVWRFDSADFNDLTYKSTVNSTRLMFDAALTVASWRWFSVYAIGGIGEAWNRIGYSDYDKDDLTCYDQRLDLGTNTTSNFAWETGAGVRVAFNDRVGLSLQYLYANLGSAHTSSSGTSGTITAPVIVPAQFNLWSHSGLLGLHITL